MIKVYDAKSCSMIMPKVVLQSSKNKDLLTSIVQRAKSAALGVRRGREYAVLRYCGEVFVRIGCTFIQWEKRASENINLGILSPTGYLDYINNSHFSFRM